jgi:hypothetical protein
LVFIQGGFRNGISGGRLGLLGLLVVAGGYLNLKSEDCRVRRG